MSLQPADPQASATRRIAVLDMARGIALLAMASYHFTWDLEFFGYADPGLTSFGGWKLYARCIASTFLFLVGVSLVLAHGGGIRWGGFWKRLAMVAAAAAAISLVTFFATPDSFIFFGILHQIALASVVGLLFLRLPALLTLAAAALVIAAPHYLRSPAFDPAWLWWLGLSEVIPRSNDYVPVFPWLGAVLAGMGVTQLAKGFGLPERLARIRPGRWSGPLQWAGRHSLAFYLVHQPVLIACVWAFAQVWPAPPMSRQEAFTKSCHATCQQNRDARFCSRYCGCMLETLDDDGTLDRMFEGQQTPDLKAHIGDLAGACTAMTDGVTNEGE